MQIWKGGGVSWPRHWRKQQSWVPSLRRFPASVGRRQTSLQCQQGPPSSETQPFSLGAGGGWGLRVTPPGSATAGQPPPKACLPHTTPALHTHPSPAAPVGRDSLQAWAPASWVLIWKIPSFPAWAGHWESLLLLRLFPFSAPSEMNLTGILPSSKY